MARSAQNPPSQSPPAWAAPTGPALDALLHEPAEHAELTPCGQWWDAVAIAPLDRGLAALDLLGLRPGDCPVLADLSRRELLVLVAAGTAPAAAGPPGVRTLTTGSWLLTPTTPTGIYAAAWLSAPAHDGPDRYPDPAALRDAVLAADARRGDVHEQRRLQTAVGAP